MITDIVRAIRDQEILTTSAENIARDFITPPDFNQLVDAILTSPPTNAVVDCYSKASIDKSTLLAELKAKFGLQYELTKNTTGVNATGTKAHYYSLNTTAALFGYLPTLSSLDGVVQEIHQIFRSSGKSLR